MGVNIGIKTIIPLDLYIELVAQITYPLMKLGSLIQFLIALSYWAAI